MTLNMIRRFLLIPPPRVSEQQALETALTFARGKKWRIVRPKIVERFRGWIVWTDQDSKSSPWILINNQTGQIIRSGCPIR